MPQQLLNIDWLAVSEGVGLGALEATGPPTFFSAPTKGKSTSTNSRSWKFKKSCQVKWYQDIGFDVKRMTFNTCSILHLSIKTMYYIFSDINMLKTLH